MLPQSAMSAHRDCGRFGLGYIGPPLALHAALMIGACGQTRGDEPLGASLPRNVTGAMVTARLR